MVLKTLKGRPTARQMTLIGRYVSTIVSAIALPNGCSGCGSCTSRARSTSPSCETSCPATRAFKPRSFGFLSPRRMIGVPRGKRSVGLRGRRSMKRGSGAGFFHRHIWIGMSASDTPNTLRIAPVLASLRMPCNAITRTRTLTWPISRPPVPGDSAPLK
eukprot:scaffold2286_cov240-Pinguiococcus_pyrenoidosus.AAC.9